MKVLRTPFYQEVPQAFTVDGGTRLVGAYAQLIKEFARFQHYDLQVMPVDNYKVSMIQKYIERGVYNISMHGGTYNNLFANISFSYPLEWSKVCIMVPSEAELPRYWYVVWPFGAYIWTVLCLSVPYVAFLMTTQKHPTSKFAHNLLYSLAVMLFCSNTNLKLKSATLRLQIFYLLLMGLGFILNSYYGSYLTVYNMRPVFQPYLKTENDILGVGIKVLVPSHVLEELRNSPYVDLKPLQSVLVEKSQVEVSSKVQNFTRTYAYVVTWNDWIFMRKIQRNLIQPLYQISDICFGNIFSTFPIQMQSEFAKSLDYFILVVQQSGLWEQWQEDAFMMAIRTKYYRVLQDEYPVDPLNLYYYRIPWIILVVGSALSCLCFMGEMVYSRYTNKD